MLQATNSKYCINIVYTANALTYFVSDIIIQFFRNYYDCNHKQTFVQTCVYTYDAFHTQMLRQVL